MKAEATLDLLHRIGHLKNLPRTGWRLRGITNAESVADHAFRVAFLAMMLADGLNEKGRTVDVERVMRLALLHDLGEAEIGDIPRTARPYLPADVKEQAEGGAVKTLAGPLGSVGKSYAALWDELTARRSIESRLLWAADGLEMMIQAWEYERAGFRGLDDFWQNHGDGDHFAEFPQARRIMDLLVSSRSAGGES